MNLKPLGDRVIVEPAEKKNGGKTKAGLYLPETVENEGPEQGKVIAVGPGKLSDDGKRIPVHVKKGDTVIFHKSYGSKEIKVGDKEYLIVREEDILAIAE
ncbi:MAG: co-chaperone GroES [bacterium]|nr:co-chaperone GroES [bacterium]